MTRILQMRILTAVLLFAVTPLSAQRPALTSQLGWLTGCWQSARGSATVEERWSSPDGGMLLGTGRTVRAGKVVDYEFTRIFERGDTLVYAALPMNQAPTEFLAARSSPADSVVFSNPAHDFPTVVAYRPVGRDSLLAWIAGGGKRVEFKYARMACSS
jgi:hypothetical protein